jgi:hypothetical protein
MSKGNDSKDYEIEITYDQYDQMLKKFEQVKASPYLPTLEQIDMWEKNPKKWLLFAIFCYEGVGKPQTKNEQYRKQTLLHFVDSHLILRD